MLIKSDILLLFFFSFILINSQTVTYPIYAQSCATQSSTRTCIQNGNITEYLMNIKKGGTDVLSPDDYEQNFFKCEQYTFDCGYVQNDKQKISIANGIQLDMPANEIDSLLPSNPTLASDIKKYANLPASDAKCGMKIFPLMLSPADSDQFFTKYMTKLATQIKNKYSLQKKTGTKTWASINVNIKTALSMIFKENKALMTSNSSFWVDFTQNNFSQMFNYLKNEFNKNNILSYLHSAYLIDSVTKKCDKLQSINFLIDQSGSITPPAFQLALDFLTEYVNQTQDDPKLMSIHFYDGTFEPYLGYNKTKAQLLAGIASKPYRALGTKTGLAINATVQQIIDGNFDKGLNKVLIVMTDGFSYDNVLYASNYARSKDITVISIGVGSNVNDVQLLEMAQTPSNIIKVAGYNDLQKMIDFISNYFCKQIINLRLNQTIVNNVVRTPDSPAYFRVEKSNTSQFYELTLKYEQDPELKNQALYTSEYDPFPDEFAQFQIKQSYRTSITEKVYFIQPLQTAPVRIKKDFYETQTIKNSYVSVGGTNIRFNISLLPCKNLNCTQQRSTLSLIGNNKNPSPTSDNDHIYAIIAGSVAALACAAVMGIFTLRKIFGQSEQLPDQLDPIRPQVTQQDLNDNFNENKSLKSVDSGRSKGSDSKRSSRNKQKSNQKSINNQKKSNSKNQSKNKSKNQSKEKDDKQKSNSKDKAKALKKRSKSKENIAKRQNFQQKKQKRGRKFSRQNFD